MLVWLLLQLGALALAAARVPLAAQYPQPAEFQAVRLVLAAQFLGSAFLFGPLLRTWQMAVVAGTSAVILLLLGAALAAWPLPDVMPAIGYVSLWIVGLFFWRMALRRWETTAWRECRPPIFCASALISTYVVGGPVLWYLNLDLASEPRFVPMAAYGPLMAALLHPLSPTTSGWVILLTLLTCGALAWGLSLAKR